MISGSYNRFLVNNNSKPVCVFFGQQQRPTTNVLTPVTTARQAKPLAIPTQITVVSDTHLHGHPKGKNTVLKALLKRLQQQAEQHSGQRFILVLNGDGLDLTYSWLSSSLNSKNPEPPNNPVYLWDSRTNPTQVEAHAQQVMHHLAARLKKSFFTPLRAFLSLPNTRFIYVLGNHDALLKVPSVQNIFLEALFPDPQQRQAILDMQKLQIEPESYDLRLADYPDSQLHFEHGHAFDPFSRSPDSLSQPSLNDFSNMMLNMFADTFAKNLTQAGYPHRLTKKWLHHVLRLEFIPPEHYVGYVQALAKAMDVQAQQYSAKQNLFPPDSITQSPEPPSLLLYQALHHTLQQALPHLKAALPKPYALLLQGAYTGLRPLGRYGAIVAMAFVKLLKAIGHSNDQQIKQAQDQLKILINNKGSKTAAERTYDTLYVLNGHTHHPSNTPLDIDNKPIDRLHAFLQHTLYGASAAQKATTAALSPLGLAPSSPNRQSRHLNTASTNRCYVFDPNKNTLFPIRNTGIITFAFTPTAATPTYTCHMKQEPQPYGILSLEPTATQLNNRAPVKPRRRLAPANA